MVGKQEKLLKKFRWTLTGFWSKNPKKIENFFFA